MATIIEEIRAVETDRRYTAFGYLFQRLAREKKIPVSCCFELTPECNLSCKMCYSRLSHAEVEKKGGLRSTEEWMEWIKESVELGAIYITFTGGECLIYPEFDKLYKYAYDLGARIIVMTNGTMITPERIDMFRERPPEAISMTLYGFSRETYEKTCNNADAYDQAFAAVEMICEAGLVLTLKCTVTKDMLSDFPKIYRYAKEKKAKFVSSNQLMNNREAGRRDYGKVVVSDAEYAECMKDVLDCSDERQLEAPLVSIDPSRQTVAYGMQCSAGRSSFAINWRGKMVPCHTMDDFSVDLGETSVTNAWEKMKEYSEKVPQLEECQVCIFQKRCRKCVFIHYADTGEFGKPSPRLCWKIQHPEEAAREEAEFLARKKMQEPTASNLEENLSDCPDEM